METGGRKKMTTYTIEEVREAVNLVVGDGGRQADEVISVLETDVEANTNRYIQSLTEKGGKHER